MNANQRTSMGQGSFATVPVYTNEEATGIQQGPPEFEVSILSDSDDRRIGAVRSGSGDHALGAVLNHLLTGHRVQDAVGILATEARRSHRFPLQEAIAAVQRAADKPSSSFPASPLPEDSFSRRFEAEPLCVQFGPSNDPGHRYVAEPAVSCGGVYVWKCPLPESLRLDRLVVVMYDGREGAKRVSAFLEGAIRGPSWSGCADTFPGEGIVLCLDPVPLPASLAGLQWPQMLLARRLADSKRQRYGSRTIMTRSLACLAAERGPQCDVVIPYCKADARFVSESVEAILNQRGVETVVHLVADGLAPEEDPHLVTFSHHSNVRKYYTRENVGPYYIVNCLFSRFETDFIAIQDADDVPRPDRIQMALHSLLRSGGHLYGGAMQQFVDPADRGNRRLQAQRHKVPVRYSSTGRGDRSIVHGTMVIRKDVFRELNGYRSGWMGGSDCHLVGRALLAGYRPYIDEQIVADRRLHSSSLTHTIPCGDLEYSRASRAAAREDYKQIEAGAPASAFGGLDGCIESDVVVRTCHRARKVHVIYDVEGWAQHHRARAISQHAPVGWKVTASRDLPVETVDAVLLLRYGYISTVAARLPKGADRPKLIVSFNAGGNRNGEALDACLEQADQTVVVNKETSNRFSSNKRVSLVTNGYSPSVFFPRIPIGKRPRRVLWSGSQVHADHKGYSLMRSLVPVLRQKGFSVDLRLVDSRNPPYPPQEMAEWYNTGTVYVIASLDEGIPNGGLEAAACGTVVVSTRVGIMPELIRDGVNGILVERTPQSILDGILRAHERAQSLTDRLSHDVQDYVWERRAPRFFQLFDELCPQDVVLSTYFTKVPDPQKHVHVEADCDENMKMAQGCLRLGIDCIVFHDGLSPSFRRRYPGITFVQVGETATLSCNDYRFLLYRDWLKDHRYRNVWTCDLFDVHLVKNPNELPTKGVLWAGCHHDRSTNSPWCRKELKRVYGRKAAVPKEQPLLMAGTWGGDYQQVVRMLDLLTREIETTGAFNCNLVAFNKVAYEHFRPGQDLITCLEPLVSRFKCFEVHRKDVCFIHK